MDNCSTESQFESLDSGEAGLYSSVVLPKSKRIGKFTFHRRVQISALPGVFVLWRVSGCAAKVAQTPSLVLGGRGPSHSRIDADDCAVLSYRIVQQLHIAGRQKFGPPAAEASYVTADNSV